MTARIGDVIYSAEQLDALPDGTTVGVVRHDDLTAYQRWGDDWCSPLGVVLDPDWLPARVLHVPGEQAHTGDDMIEQAARAIRDELGDGLTYDSIVPEAATVALADAGFLRQESPTRDEIARAIYDALSGQYGDFRTPYDAADAVMDLLKGEHDD